MKYIDSAKFENLINNIVKDKQYVSLLGDFNGKVPVFENRKEYRQFCCFVTDEKFKNDLSAVMSEEDKRNPYVKDFSRSQLEEFCIEILNNSYATLKKDKQENMVNNANDEAKNCFVVVISRAGAPFVDSIATSPEVAAEIIEELKNVGVNTKRANIYNDKGMECIPTSLGN